MTALDGWIEIAEGKPEQDCRRLLMGRECERRERETERLQGRLVQVGMFTICSWSAA